MNYDLTEEEVETIRECVTQARDALIELAARIEGNGSARARQDALLKVRNCNDVLRTLSEEIRYGAGIQ